MEADESGAFENPFAKLSSEGLPPGPIDLPQAKKPVAKNRGRVDIIRQKAGRGGKTVTVVTNFVGIGLPEKEKLAREIQKNLRGGGLGERRTDRNSGGQTGGSSADFGGGWVQTGIRRRVGRTSRALMKGIMNRVDGGNA